MERTVFKISLGESDVNRLKSIKVIGSVRSFVEGDNGVFFRHMPILDTGTKNVEITNVETGIFGMMFKMRFKKLSRTDKIEIFMHNEIYCSENKKLVRRFYPESALDEFSPRIVREVDLLRYRMKFLIPIALSSVIIGTYASVYAYNQKPNSRLIRINHPDAYSFSRRYVKYTGDFKTDFQAALVNLWFNYPIDITGFDDKIKRITLEELNK